MRSRSRWNGVRSPHSASKRSRRAVYDGIASSDSQAASRACWAAAKSLVVGAVIRHILTAVVDVIGRLRKVGTKFLCVGPGAIVGVDDRRLRGGHARYRNAERRARDVIEPRHVEELDRVGVSAMLTADAELEIRTRLAPHPRGE